MALVNRLAFYVDKPDRRDADCSNFIYLISITVFFDKIFRQSNIVREFRTNAISFLDHVSMSLCIKHPTHHFITTAYGFWRLSAPNVLNQSIWMLYNSVEVITCGAVYGLHGHRRQACNPR